MTLSESAKQALINSDSHQGAKVSDNILIHNELSRNGLIGTGCGLTRKGTIEREKLVRAAEDAAFGF